MVPRIWADTIDTHRRQVNDAILQAAAELIAEQGPFSLAMSAIAERAGIGRATLYKYFPDVDAIVVAVHAQGFGEHLHRLVALSEADEATLDDVLEFVGSLRRHHRHAGRTDTLGTIAHSPIEREIVARFTTLLAHLAERHEVRDDADPELLARWLFHVIHAPGDIDDGVLARLLGDSLASSGRRRRRPSTRRTVNDDMSQ